MGKRWLNKVLGITKAKRAFAKATGIPTSRSGRRVKVGCSVMLFAFGTIGCMAIVFVSYIKYI